MVGGGGGGGGNGVCDNDGHAALNVLGRKNKTPVEVSNPASREVTDASSRQHPPINVPPIPRRIRFHYRDTPAKCVLT